VLFLWGGSKPVNFHSGKWLEIVRASGGTSAAIGGGGHWFLETHAEETNRRIAGWLRETGHPAPS
jgi:hypothetical protein